MDRSTAHRERPSRLPGAVLWSRLVPAGGEVRRILPDGCIDLIWVDGRLIVAGPDTVAHLAHSTAGWHYTGLRMPPGVGPAVLGLPADAFRDARCDLSDLWPAASARRVVAAVGTAAAPGAALEEFAGGRLADRSPDPVARRAAALLATGAGVREIAAGFGLSERQLHRRCLAAFGYGPKRLARIQRMRRALALIEAGTRPRGVPGGHTLADVAAAAGYADQAHLSREVRALAGVPLGALSRR